MIPREELMIGNMVNLAGLTNPPFKVIGINTYEGKCAVSNENYAIKHVSYQELMPIQLDTKWLIKNGFGNEVNKDIRLYIEPEGNKLTILSGYNSIGDTNEVVLKGVSSVHSFQNMYLLYYGKPFEVKL